MMYAAVNVMLVDVEGGEQQPRYSSHNPSKALLRNVLSDAFVVRDLVRKGNNLFLSQLELDRMWFFSQDESPFSFLWLCQHLALDPRKIQALYFSAEPVTIPRWWAA